MRLPSTRPIRQRAVPVLALLALPLCPFSVTFGERNGRLEGTVLKDGEGVAGVVVLVLGLNRVEVTTADGNFVFENIPPGTYSLSLTLGKNAAARENVGVLAGQTRSPLPASTNSHDRSGHRPAKKKPASDDAGFSFSWMRFCIFVRGRFQASGSSHTD